MLALIGLPPFGLFISEFALFAQASLPGGPADGRRAGTAGGRLRRAPAPR